jgi:hypothetical protein
MKLLTYRTSAGARLGVLEAEVEGIGGLRNRVVIR